MRLKLHCNSLLAPSQRFWNSIFIVKEFCRVNLQRLRRDSFSVDQYVECLQPATLAPAICASQLDRFVANNLQVITEPVARTAQSFAVKEHPVNRAFLFVVMLRLALLVAWIDPVYCASFDFFASRLGCCNIAFSLFPLGCRIHLPIDRVAVICHFVERRERNVGWLADPTRPKI